MPLTSKNVADNITHTYKIYHCSVLNKDTLEDWAEERNMLSCKSVIYYSSQELVLDWHCNDLDT